MRYFFNRKPSQHFYWKCLNCIPKSVLPAE